MEKIGSLVTSSEISDEKRSKAREKRKNKRTRDSESDDELKKLIHVEIE